MKINKIALVSIILILLFNSCVTSKKVRYLQNPDLVIPEYEEITTPADYKVQVLDELYIRVKTLDPEISKLFNITISTQNSGQLMTTTSPGFNSYTVKEDGNISFPYIGDIYVLGKTTREIKKVVSDTLSLMVNELSVDVKLMNSYFSIISDSRDGRYPITKERLNIFQALALSGDLNDFADRGQVKIIRQTPEGSVVHTFDVRSKQVIDSEFYYIQPNDVIYVYPFKGEFFGISSFSALFGVISSVINITLVVLQLTNVF
jgi:polysaccharide export outer membrane protein